MPQNLIYVLQYVNGPTLLSTHMSKASELCAHFSIAKEYSLNCGQSLYIIIQEKLNGSRRLYQNKSMASDFIDNYVIGLRKVECFSSKFCLTSVSARWRVPYAVI